MIGEWSANVDMRIMRWFKHMERLDEGRMVNKILMQSPVDKELKENCGMGSCCVECIK